MKRLRWLTLLLALATGIGCTNPFDTRTPEDPDPGSGQPLVNNLQTNPDSLVAQMKLAFRLRDSKVYQDCFADPLRIGVEFLFIPEQDEAPRLTNWNLASEAKYFSNFVNAGDLVSVELKDSVLSGFETSLDTFKTEFIYLITAEFRTKTERYQGRSILGILRAASDQLWYIYEWVDLPDRSDSTWSTLKANYR